MEIKRTLGRSVATRTYCQRLKQVDDYREVSVVSHIDQIEALSFLDSNTEL